MDIQHTPVRLDLIKPAHFLLGLPEAVNFAELRQQLNKKADDVYVPELAAATQSNNLNTTIPVFNEGSILNELNERNLHAARKMMHKYHDQVEIDLETTEPAEENKFKFDRFLKPDPAQKSMPECARQLIGSQRHIEAYQYKNSTRRKEQTSMSIASI